jgi:hypothetical protein
MCFYCTEKHDNMAILSQLRTAVHGMTWQSDHCKGQL